MKWPLTMEYSRGGRYHVWNGSVSVDSDVQNLVFPKEKEILNLWEKHCPGKMLHIGSDISEPVSGFWADAGPGTTPAQRQAFCEDLLLQCKEMTA